MEVMFDRVAGLDVGKETLTVCVRTPGPRGGRRSETRTFKTTTGSLHLMRDWLDEAGVIIAAMESTSAYWKPPFYCLEEVMEVWLLNLGHASAALTLDIYAGLFADDLDAVADRLDRAFVKLNADQMRTKRRTSRSDQTELPFENPPEQGTG